MVFKTIPIYAVSVYKWKTMPKPVREYILNEKKKKEKRSKDDNSNNNEKHIATKPASMFKTYISQQ